VVPQTTIDELLPFEPLLPPPPIVTAPVEPDAHKSRFLKPPAPPAPAALVLKSVVTACPPAPPATIKVLIILVPGCKLILGVPDVLTV
jgi:hypothetical protein